MKNSTTIGDMDATEQPGSSLSIWGHLSISTSNVISYLSVWGMGFCLKQLSKSAYSKYLPGSVAKHFGEWTISKDGILWHLAGFIPLGLKKLLSLPADSLFTTEPKNVGDANGLDLNKKVEILADKVPLGNLLLMTADGWSICANIIGGLKIAPNSVGVYQGVLGFFMQKSVESGDLWNDQYLAIDILIKQSFIQFASTVLGNDWAKTHKIPALTMLGVGMSQVATNKITSTVVNKVIDGKYCSGSVKHNCFSGNIAEDLKEMVIEGGANAALTAPKITEGEVKFGQLLKEGLGGVEKISMPTEVAWISIFGGMVAPPATQYVLDELWAQPQGNDTVSNSTLYDGMHNQGAHNSTELEDL
jgi:hypothetical protein